MSSKNALRQLIDTSSLHTVELLVSRVLARSGFGDIEILDRREPKEKSSLKGCELLCRCSVGTLEIRIIVKVIKDSIRTRMLDELAGAIDRTKADFGVIVSTKDLPERARALKDEYSKSRVDVVDLALFTDMLLKYKIGVRPNGEPDFAFFSELDGQLDRVNAFLDYERLAR